MSHEIRTPMNAIIGLTHLLRRADPTPPQAERLDKIEVAANHLLSIINDILDLSKIEAGKLQIEHTNFELSAVLNHVRSLIAEQALIKGLALTVDPDAVPLWLRGDPTRLRQALLNYASNAVKFTERGSIALRAVLLDERDDGLWLRFEVQDTGVGIAAEKLGGLFRAFEQADTSTTRQYGGTGLGLAITKHLALLMGGDAGADSVPGRGSTFWFTAVVQRGHGAMPAVSKARKDAETELRSSFFGARLLLAEDDSINREVALELLHAVGLTAEVACNGREALRMAARAHYDLVLMDMQMPQLNGLDATRAIRRLPGWSEIPILAMTANAFSGERMACEDAGMNDFIAKPVNPDALYRTLLRWLCTVPPAAPMASGTNPATAAPSTVDPTSTLRRLASIAGLSPARGLAGVRGNKALYLRVLRIFVHRGAETKRKLGGAIASEDLTELEQLAHNLKGSAGTLGAIELDNIATALQAEIRLRSSTTEAIRLGNALMGELVHLLEDLGTVLEEQ
jgi:CheY-like chemotaxis protein